MRRNYRLVGRWVTVLTPTLQKKDKQGRMINSARAMTVTSGKKTLTVPFDRKLDAELMRAGEQEQVKMIKKHEEQQEKERRKDRNYVKKRFYDRRVMHATGRVKLAGRSNTLVVLPAVESTWATEHGMLDSSVFRKKYKFKLKGTTAEMRKVPFEITVGVILRTKDGKILVQKRSQKVKQYKGMYAPTTGALDAPTPSEIRKGKAPNLAKQALEEIKEELGIPKKKVKFVGPGFTTLEKERLQRLKSVFGKKLKKPIPPALTVYDDLSLANPTPVYVANVDLTENEIRKLQKNNDEVARLKFIPEEPKALEDFDKNPLVVHKGLYSLYARELLRTRKAKP